MIDIFVCVGLLIVIVLCGILNRLRGTGVIKHFGTLNIVNKKIEVKFVGNHLYGLYLALVFGLLTMNVFVGLSVLVTYLLGESAGWGKWLGWLVTDVDKRNVKLVEGHQLDDEGKGYPWIHYIVSLVLPEKDKSFSDEERISRQTSFSTLALMIRGLYWWLPVYLVLAIFQIITYQEALIIATLLGIAFPIACEVGKRIKFNKTYDLKFIKLSFSQGWENQEVVYGLFQGIALWYTIIFLV